jgi:excisionase family DNA binding protein
MFQEELYSKRQVGEFLKISQASVDRLRKRGELEALKLGSRVLFRASTLASFIERHSQAV